MHKHECKIKLIMEREQAFWRWEDRTTNSYHRKVYICRIL